MFLVNLEKLVVREHPLCEVKQICHEVLDNIKRELPKNNAQKERTKRPPEQSDSK